MPHSRTPTSGNSRLIEPVADTPYDTIEEAQEWWRGVDLPVGEKDAVGRVNAIRLFKLPLEE
jgi:hypothetical protein